MKKNLLLSLFLFCSNTIIFSQIPAGYYDGTAGLHSLFLKNKIHQIISKNTISWNYGDLPLWYESTDRDSFYENDGSLLDLYSENPAGADPYNYTYESPSLISGASSEGLGWNREHTFSQSLFYGNYPMYSDLHFVIPTDARVNQRRSNYPFAVVNSSPTFTSLNGSKVGLSVTDGYTLTVFEPIDEFKGDFARIFFYIATRYEDLIPFFDTSNARNPFESRAEIAIRPWQINLLMSWHLSDPVSEREIHRNNAVYAIQGNRNPFIDHPEWVADIWETSTDMVAPDAPSYFEIALKGENFIHFVWATSPESDLLGYEVFRNDTFIGTTKNNYFTYTDLEPSTSYIFKIRAYDAHYNRSEFSLPITTSTMASDAYSNDLYFSKIIVGSESNRAIEITNNTGHPVDLRHYTINKREINEYTGSLYWSNNPYRLSGYLPNGRKLVIVHPDWNLPCFDIDSADVITKGTPMMFVGNTALRLNKNDTSIDLFGHTTDTITFAANASIYRASEIREPNIVFTPSEWVWHELDYCDSLGNGQNEDTTTSIIPQGIPDISIYPNPLQQGEPLLFTGKQLKQIKAAQLFDIYGRMVWEEKSPFLQNAKLQIPFLPIGIYILKLDNKIFKLTITSH